MEVLFSEFTVWHWVGLALILLAFEMMIGTFDLLWIAVAAGTAALYAALAPEQFSTWQYEVAVFALAAIAFVFIGRKVSEGFKNPPSTHPSLNERSSSMVGKTAIVTSVFSGGFGRVKINDSEWRAQSDANDLSIGDTVEITGSQGATVTVRAI